MPGGASALDAATARSGGSAARRHARVAAAVPGTATAGGVTVAGAVTRCGAAMDGGAGASRIVPCVVVGSPTRQCRLDAVARLGRPGRRRSHPTRRCNRPPDI